MPEFIVNQLVSKSVMVNLVKHKFSGRRVKRSLYKSRDKQLINADVNSALNILRKHLKVAKKNIMFNFVEASSTPASGIYRKILVIVYI